MRPFLRTLPFLALGLVGGLGLLVATVQRSPSLVRAPAPAELPASFIGADPVNAPFTLEAAFDHEVLPRDAETAFLRVALTGRADPSAPRMPAELTLLIDRSGSMSGDKLENARRAARRALEALQPGDRFRVMAFGSVVTELGHGIVREGADAAAETKARIDQLVASGGTDMVAALDRLRPSTDEERVARVLLLSDGQPDTEVGLQERVRALASAGTITTTVGVGLDYNEDLMAALADAGRGNYHFVERATDLGGVFEKELDDVSQVVARDVVVSLDSSAEPLGAPRLAGDALAVAAGDLYAGRTVELLFEVPLQRGVDPAIQVLARAASGAQIALARATRSDDADAVAASVNAAVQVQAAKWQASQVWLESNRLFNEGRAADANALIDRQLKTLGAQSAQYGSADLQQELAELETYQAQNARGEARRSLNNYAKWKARGMNR